MVREDPIQLLGFRLMDADLFNTNASIVRDLAKAAADAAPNANLLVISNPVRISARELQLQY